MMEYRMSALHYSIPTVIVISLLNATEAQSALIENLTVGNAKALALGHAVTADPPGIDSIHFNPAGLARLSGEQRQIKLIVGSFDIRVDFGEHDPIVDQYYSDAYAADTVPPGTFDDPVVNTTSRTSGAAFVLPGQGLVKLPAIVAPLGGASYQAPGSKVTFATSVYSPTAAGYYRDKDDPGRFLGEEVSFSRITYFSPSVGVQVTDTLSLGASLGFSYQGIAVGMTLRVPNIGLVFAEGLGKAVCEQETPAINICGGRVGPYTEVSELELEAEEMLSTTFNLGLLWEPTPWLTVGLSYQSGAVDTLKGSYKLSYDSNWTGMWQEFHKDTAGAAIAAGTAAIGFPLPIGKTVEEGEVAVELPTPAHYAVGISVQLTPTIKVNVDYKMSDWQAWKDLEITFDQDVDFLKLARIVQPSAAEMRVLRMPMQFENVWNWGVGIEYQYSDNLALRFGYEPRPSSIPADKHTVLLPVGDGELYATGLSYQLDANETLDLSLAYFNATRSTAAGESDTSNSLNQSYFIYNPYMGTDYDSDVTAVIFALSYQSKF